ncbi:hypothetical protein OH786_15710 [Streptomyces atratus]|jgi:hypothetical protein|uniref:Uncharacterized protein n=1 Tax=Streptomyces atratus TaxID=1893 RepID=A0A1K2ENG9_STRAR|nr:hypothetical protein [Streptomyces atratus]SFY36580.1 hypothetical protein SAMN02787144_1020127 [Streptomyces atratus]
MNGERGADLPPHRTQVEAKGGSNAFNTGSGSQYVKFGGVWAQAVVLIAGVAGASVGIVMAPEASKAQYVFYCVLLILCAITSVVCLWFACDGARKRLVAFVGLVAAAVGSAALAAGSYKLLADHGDLDAHIVVQSDGPMGSLDEAEMTVDAASSRSHLRIKVFIEDQLFGDMCDVESTVSVMPVVDGKPLKDEAVKLENENVGDINLHGAREHVKLRAVVDTSKSGENCRLNLRFDSAVLHDHEWWLL